MKKSMLFTKELFQIFFSAIDNMIINTKYTLISRVGYYHSERYFLQDTRDLENPICGLSTTWKRFYTSCAAVSNQKPPCCPVSFIIVYIQYNNSLTSFL